MISYHPFRHAFAQFTSGLVKIEFVSHIRYHQSCESTVTVEFLGQKEKF